jgi:hypothetical protein
MSDGIVKIPFLALIKETKERKILTSYGYGAQDSKGNFYHKTKYKVIKPLPDQKFIVGKKK